MDGVTTNGILLMHLEGQIFDTNAKPTKWKEVSVGGSVFDLGEGRLKFNYQSAVISRFSLNCIFQDIGYFLLFV